MAELDSQALEKLRVVGCFLAAVAKPLAPPLTLMGDKNRLFFGAFGIFGDGLNERRSSDINRLE